MFGDPVTNPMRWKTTTLSNICTKITDGEHGTVARYPEGRLYLMARNVTKSNCLDFTEISYISEEDHKRIYKRCNPEPGDLLLVCVGATIGKAALVPNIDQFSMARSVALLKPNFAKVNSQFLLYLVIGEFVQQQIKNSIHAAAQGGLYTNTIKSLTTYLPSIDIQNRFADFVKQVDKSKFTVLAA